MEQLSGFRWSFGDRQVEQAKDLLLTEPKSLRSPCFLEQCIDQLPLFFKDQMDALFNGVERHHAADRHRPFGS